MTPLPGCRTTADGVASAQDAKNNTFKIEHANRTYTLVAPTRDAMAKLVARATNREQGACLNPNPIVTCRWAALIDLAANAELTSHGNLVVEP